MENDMKGIPRKMSAIQISNPGGPEALEKVEREIPRLQENEVLIKISACGINRPDLMQRSGLYPPPPGASDIPGLEVSGQIVDVHPTANRWVIGDEVCALVNGGGYAEYVSVPGTQCLPIPDGVSLLEAASLPETYFTVWVNVFDRAKLQSGERILVQGGGSGIGVTAIQLAKSMGCEVYVTAGTDEKCKKCEDLGAKRAINYKTENFCEVIIEETKGSGVNVVLDMVGGSYIQDEIKCLADDGRLAIIAFLGGAKSEINFTDILTRRISITGSTLRPRSTIVKGLIAKNLEKKVWPLFSKGLIRPVIDCLFPFDKASTAHELMESGDHFGKIILTL